MKCKSTHIDMDKFYTAMPRSMPKQCPSPSQRNVHVHHTAMPMSIIQIYTVYQTIFNNLECIALNINIIDQQHNKNIDY